MTADTIKSARKHVFLSCISPVIASGVDSIRSGMYNLLRTRTLRSQSEFQIVADTFMRNQIDELRSEIYKAVSSDVDCRSFFDFQIIDNKRVSKFKKLIILMSLIGYSDGEIACYLFTDKTSVRTNKSSLKKEYPDLLADES